ncbi:MAG: hypothetical protein A2Y25_04485 [Candidatus Melainabacteria bacterium GWF2_37_15]|nr:MAG: hypothetical protein A2Y25_04485 [Candidatus Melainabacteria bacterium GWF2_37_15]
MYNTYIFCKKRKNFLLFKNMRQKSYKKGFTFMEIMVATVIIGVVAAFLTSSMPLSVTVGQEVQDVSKATDLAQRYLETVKSELSYASQYDVVQAGTTPPVPVTSDFTDSGYFTVQTNVTNLETATINGVSMPVLKEIDVNYLRSSDSLSVVNISTLIARPE